MAGLTRRRFLIGTSAGVGVAVAGGLAALPHAVPSRGPAGGIPGWSRSEPMVLHVRDAATGEVALLAGTSEVIYRDPQLVRRLLGSAARLAPGWGS